MRVRAALKAATADLHDDLDGILDSRDQQVSSTDSQPVRAIRAVSTHTSSRELIGTVNPKRGNRALTALIISTAGLAVVVVCGLGLLMYGAIHTFAVSGRPAEVLGSRGERSLAAARG